MKRLKLPLDFRLQNFLFLQNDEVFWTSASLTVFQKIKRFLTKDKEYLCNTSRHYTLPINGQYITLAGFNIVNNMYGESKFYDIDTGRFVFSKRVPYTSLNEIRKLVPTEYLQGLTWKNNYTHHLALFGKPSNSAIYIKDVNTRKTVINVKYEPKWWWKYWEARGIQLDEQGNTWIGISVKSRFGFIVNYIKKVK